MNNITYEVLVGEVVLATHLNKEDAELLYNTFSKELANVSIVEITRVSNGEQSFNSTLSEKL